MLTWAKGDEVERSEWGRGREEMLKLESFTHSRHSSRSFDVSATKNSSKQRQRERERERGRRLLVVSSTSASSL